MKKSVLVLGSTGMLGHQVVKYLLESDEYEIFDVAFRYKLREKTIIANSLDKSKFEKIITELSPDFIVNCIGTLINGSNNLENAIYLNAYLPHQLKKISKIIGAKLIHISTDCVFSGNKKNPYTEFDKKDGHDFYAKTKSLGEIDSANHLTIRTSVIGPELKDKKFLDEGLFHWFMGQSVSASGFSKTIWSGVTSIELAKAIKWAIDNHIVGLYHITNGDSISKHDLLHLFNKYTEKNLKIVKVSGLSLNKSFIDTRKELDYKVPSYEEMIRKMVYQIRKNKKIYNHYNLEI